MSKISDKAYNEKRKELLMRKDRNETVSNVDFGMYDLTPYMKTKESPSLFENIIFYENSLRKIQHLKGKNAYFTPEQEDALNFISKQENNRIILSAPTSFGKTLILKEYIYRNKPNVVVFIVPTNALSYELEESFKTNKSFDNIQIFDKCFSSSELTGDEKLLFIGTQEKFQEIADALPPVDLFVIDEAYKLQETTKKQRGYRLSEAFLKSISLKSNKIVLLSPNAEFLGFEKYGFVIYQTEFNAVDRVFEQLNQDNFNQVLFSKIKNEKTILYFDSPDCISTFVSEASVLPIKTSDVFTKMLEQEFHREWSAVKLLKRGILTHHGLMPKYVQNKMLNLFLKDPTYNLLVGTNSISEGINTPTKNIFFAKNCSFKKDKLLYKNTIGRAGRLGQYPIGHIYSVSEFESIEKEKIQIELAVSKEDDKNEIDETNDSTAVDSFCLKNQITLEFYEKFIRPTGLSLSKLKLIFEELSKDIQPFTGSGLFNIPKMVSNVFKSDYPIYRVGEDQVFIRGTLQKAFKNQYGTYVKLDSYENKIQFFRAKFKDAEQYSDSKIVDGYIRFLYSTLEYYILPIMNIGKLLEDNFPSWKFGQNVKEVIDDFFTRYYENIVGYDFSGLSTDQLKIISVLKEYGISIKRYRINEAIITEISNTLNKRFSTFDVISAIKKLAHSQSPNAKIYLNLINYYSL